VHHPNGRRSRPYTWKRMSRNDPGDMGPQQKHLIYISTRGARDHRLPAAKKQASRGKWLDQSLHFGTIIPSHSSAHALHSLVFLSKPLPVQRVRESSAAVVRSVQEGVRVGKGLIHDCRRCSREGVCLVTTIPTLAGLGSKWSRRTKTGNSFWGSFTAI